MKRPFPPEVQRRLRALYLYVKAMETGDLESIAHLLRLAEQDAVLDCMFLEIDQHYQAQDQMLLEQHELAVVDIRIEQILLAASEPAQAWQNGAHIQPAPHVLPLAQESGQITMNYRSASSISEQATESLPQVQVPHPTPRRKRTTRFIQVLAAVLLVFALLGGFLALFTHFTNRQPGLGIAARSTPQAQPSGIFVAISATSNSNNLGGTIQAYGLRSASNTPIWSIVLTQLTVTKSTAQPGGGVTLSVAQPGKIITLNQIAYIPVGNEIFALQVNTGKLLWKKTLPTNSSDAAVLKGEGDILVARWHDKNYLISLSRLNEQDGSTLWQYQTGDTGFAVSNGIVYAGKDEVTSMFTPNPGALRSLNALDASNGHVKWSHTNILPLSITIYNDTLYVQSIAADNTGSDKRYFLSAWTPAGHKLWSGTDPGQGSIVSDNNLLVEQVGPNLCAYQTTNGQKVWCTNNATQTFIVGSMTMDTGPSYAGYVAQKGVIYAAYTVQTSMTAKHQSTASFLQALNIQTGAVLWSQKVGTTDMNRTQNGTQTHIGSSTTYKGLNFGLASPPLLSQSTLSIVSAAKIFTFSLADGHQLWVSSITLSKDSIGFVSATYVEP